MAEQDFGGIWLEEDGDGVKLNIRIEGKKYTGKKNDRKTAENHPDYRITNEAGEDAGAAWKGETKQQNKKLSIKLKDYPKSLTAVQRKEPKENEPHMVIFAPN